jgi:hypothetical protein
LLPFLEQRYAASRKRTLMQARTDENDVEKTLGDVVDDWLRRQGDGSK